MDVRAELPQNDRITRKSLPSDSPVLDLDGFEKARKGIRESTFSVSFFFLDPEARNDLATFYLFCRVVDDIVDETPDKSLAEERLLLWREFFSGETLPEAFPHPLGHDLRDLVHRRRIPLSLFRDILDGMETDLRPVRIPDIEALRRYCYLAAGAVGRACIPIFGGEIEELGEYADSLGEAFQLTNILRDLKSDARRNRIYLPADRMQAYGVSDRDVLEGRLHPGFLRLLEEIWMRADDDYRRAVALLSDRKKWKIMKAARVMEVFYREIHRKIRLSGFDVYRHRIRLSPLLKGWLLLRFWTASFPEGTSKLSSSREDRHG
ncbi:MAG: squalene/phytoene synthase family protein [Nitrospirae bacterium]|uniref:phytoene/squalene synthase family protein n=1 Tax=Leptospirillum ferriphilum TaxID=178606 RepID=UPI0006B176C2|nr:squalene/phytoene synthase family protein [Leptospirillum ferriphilum]MCL5259040.1 squalene/phytoene synthase family protein [Nitrospirota bacterium]